MDVVLHHPGNNADFEPLNFALAGIFDIELAVKNNKLDSAYAFLKTGHPRHFRKPSMIVSVNQDLKEVGHSSVPFGVFFATTDLNPNSNRPLMTQSELVEYRNQFSILTYDYSWSSWDQVIDLYRPDNEVPSP